MDAQNAAEPDRTKPAATSPQRRRGSLVESKLATGAAAAKSLSPVKDAQAQALLKRESTTKTDEDRDSDAETIVLPGKDGHSPSKVRKVRQEDDDSDHGGGGGEQRPKDKRRSQKDDAAVAAAAGAGGVTDDNNNNTSKNELRKKKKKRLSSNPDKDSRPRNKDSGGSSGLSSAPASPPPPERPAPRKLHHKRRRSEAGFRSDSDSDASDRRSSSKGRRDRSKNADRSVSQKRKTPKVEESDDEGGGGDNHRKARRQRTISIGVDGARATTRDGRGGGGITRAHRENRTHSISPPPRYHRRSTSTQLPSQASNGFGQKKKRLPPPLQPTSYHSDDSSSAGDSGGSPPRRSAKLRSLATPNNADSTISPAKIGPHKKHLDAHGQTLLARACARGEYDGVKTRLLERPEDLNVADYAGNTPLQIAAINGCEDIVKLLIEAGCNLDCVNYDKETPLLDAVDNGHLGVVKLLLAAGVNPRKANVSGEEPIDRVDDDDENGPAIRAALVEAKKKVTGERRRTSEEHHSHGEAQDTRESYNPDSPRHSPAATAAASRRGANVRSTKTRNDLLYMPLDDKTLRQAAGRGDEETVARILQVKEGFDDPESMVAAARGGHDLVIQLLLGLGGANADPAPVTSLPGEFATPILASIGQENIKVVELLLEQQSFDPTRRFKGETYYEIARRRQGTNWKEEEDLLKNAYDDYKRSQKEPGNNTKSPGRRERDKPPRLGKREESRLSSRDGEPKKKQLNASKLSSPGNKRRSDSFSTVGGGEEETHKRGPGRPRKEDRAPHVDRDTAPKTLKVRRPESDVAAMSSEGESLKPRRKLVSKGELRGEREKHKRVVPKEPSSPRDSSNRDDSPERIRLSEKYHDRAKALKRDESKDGDGTTKRHRTSITPDRPSDADRDEGEIPVKRRRLETDGGQQEKRSKRTTSSSSDRAAQKTKDGKSIKSREDEDGDDAKNPDSKASRRSNSGELSIQVKSEEDVDVAMSDANALSDIPQKSSTDKDNNKDNKDNSDKNSNTTNSAKKDAEKELRKKEEEEEAEAAARAIEEQNKREEEERKAREAREAAQAAEKEAAEKKKRKEEQERKQREEEERQRKEQLEREAAAAAAAAAAEEARRVREEEERKERERRERAHREEMERKRAAREAEARRVREEQERAKLDKLPPLLRWLHMCPNPKSAAVAEKFKYMLGIRYDTIRQQANGTPEGREQWVLNTHVALLLGEKDLDLSRYTAWERVPVSRLAKITIWRTEWPRYSLLSEKLWDLGRQIPGYYGDEDPSGMSFKTKEALKRAAWDRFLNTELFFVRISDLMYTVPNISHLRNIKLAVEYRELLESEADVTGWRSGQKWKHDPDADRFFGFAPRNKYYVNGSFVGEDMPTKHQTSKVPFPEARVPRRGLVRVFPEDPDYDSICMQQGLDHLVKPQESLMVEHNGVHLTPLVNGTNGHTPPVDKLSATNGI